MDAYFRYLNGLVSISKARFAAFPGIKWINPYNAHDLQEIRNGLINSIGDSVLFKGTKPFYKQISKGCELCGRGVWSCLFITGRCNAHCFYCPSQQLNDEQPTSQGLTFPTASSYAEYVSHFKFEGVSFSGGEPLLLPDRVLDYLLEIRKICPSDLYIWMYTNGIPGNREIFQKLAESGLNEIRFDIGATGYGLEKIQAARGLTENITIEIPAVPEEKERIKRLLPEMVRLGVTNLNLHQLRLTDYNVSNLVKRNYTFIPAEKPIVLESELAALEIIQYAKTHHIDIGINYCSFFFKNRYQPAGFRKQVTGSLASKTDLISSKGYIRNCTTQELDYHSMRVTDEVRKADNSELLELSFKKYHYSTDLIHHQKIADLPKHHLISTLIASDPDNIPVDEDLFQIWMHEHLERGLREY